MYLRRTKEEVLKDSLPEKFERVVFCEPSALQKAIYRHILSLPDFVLVSQANAPCDCGVNRMFFLNYERQTTSEKRKQYYRDHKKELIPRCKCCHKIPLVKNSSILDPRAILWHQQHPSGEPCAQCPFCIGFTAINICYKLSSHVGLLLPESPPENFEEGTQRRKELDEKLAKAKAFIPAGELLSQLPGKTYIREPSIMDDHFLLSGKMRVLDRLLRRIKDEEGRVLVFSASVQMLRVIEVYVKSKGYSFLYMDGTTPAKQREELVDRFQQGNNFAFLLSTKAMGLGLNLTAASFVICFDVEWNPSVSLIRLSSGCGSDPCSLCFSILHFCFVLQFDSQAQDRAYRIGQEENVKVFRLVAAGTSKFSL
jgi:SNF2 family DNA or RNA helicase